MPTNLRCYEITLVSLFSCVNGMRSHARTSNNLLGTLICNLFFARMHTLSLFKKLPLR